MKNVHNQELQSQIKSNQIKIQRDPSPLPTQVPHHSYSHQELVQHLHSNFNVNSFPKAY